MYIRVDSFDQPTNIPERFNDFVERQVAAGYEPERTPSASVEDFISLRGPNGPMVVYPMPHGLVTARYEVSDLNPALHRLDLRFSTAPDAANVLTTYSTSQMLDGALLAQELREDMPQVLAQALGVEPFERGLVETTNSLPPRQERRIVGADEFTALGMFLLGHSL